MNLHIEKAIYGGAGLGRIGGEGPLAGKAVFVPLALPGEHVECEIVDDRRGFANARFLNAIEPSPFRIAPGCKYFSICGGCQYQHGSYEAQLTMKRDILLETFTRAGISGTLDKIDILAGEPWQYRNRIRLHIRFGDFALCYRESASQRNVAVEHCPIAAPLLETAIKAFPEAALASSLEAGLFEETEFFTDEDEGTLLASFWTSRSRAATRALPILCEALREAVPQFAGALLLESETARAPGHRRATWGKPQLTYNVNGQSYQVGVDSFFQTNRFVLPQMLSHAIAGKSGHTAWDLYAGVGLFAVPLTESFQQVVAVESSASSVRDLRQNLDGKQHRIVASTTFDFLTAHARDKQVNVPGHVFVDPPRAGLGKDVTTLLSRIETPAITYMSCDPTTLARDVQQLLQLGYQLGKIALVDLFPQTYHIETIVELIHS